MRVLVFIVLAVLLGGCASRPVTPRIAQVDPLGGYRYETRALRNSELLVVLAFSGGGTRAAAFSYGVLELLRSVEVRAPGGGSLRLLDAVDIVTGVSG